MKKTSICAVVTLCIVLMTQSAQSYLITLDAETPATGRNLDTTPLTTSFGTISFVGTVLPQYVTIPTSQGSHGTGISIQQGLFK